MFTKIYEKIKEFIKENYKGLIAIVVVFLLFMIELPYSIYTPGGAVDLNKRIAVSDGYEAEGSFNMAYVSMVRGSIPFLLLSYIIPDWDIVSADEITIEGEIWKKCSKEKGFICKNQWMQRLLMLIRQLGQI